jgi:hypothetical protein
MRVPRCFGRRTDRPRSHQFSVLRRSTMAVLLAGALLVLSSAPAMADGYDYTGYSPFDFHSAEGTAHAVGEVKWYQGNTCGVSFFGCFWSARIIRGEYHGQVTADRPTGCLWVRVNWGYPTGSVSVPPSVSASGQSVQGNWLLSCRRGVQREPAPISLEGIDYAKTFLLNTTITICTSHLGETTPRYCSNQKMWELGANQ